MEAFAREIILVIAVIVYTVVLFKALSMLKRELETEFDRQTGGGESFDRMTTLRASFMAQEKIVDDQQNEIVKPGLPMVSKVAVGLGSLGMGTLFVGLNYWMIYAFFMEKTSQVEASQVGWYFLAGSAMFLPYAFDRLAKVFGVNSD